MKNATELGVDPDRLAVVGGSAGGGLAAAVTLLSRDRGGPSIAFQLLICPALDDRMRTRSAATFTDVPAFDSAAVAQMWPHYIPARAETATELARRCDRVRAPALAPRSGVRCAPTGPVRCHRFSPGHLRTRAGTAIVRRKGRPAVLKAARSQGDQCADR